VFLFERIPKIQAFPVIIVEKDDVFVTLLEKGVSPGEQWRASGVGLVSFCPYMRPIPFNSGKARFGGSRGGGCGSLSRHVVSPRGERPISTSQGRP